MTMKKVLLFLLANCLSAYADWSIAPDGCTPLYLKPSDPGGISHIYSLNSADRRYVGGVSALHINGQWYPDLEGKIACPQLIDLLTRQEWYYWHDGTWHLKK